MKTSFAEPAQTSDPSASEAEGEPELRRTYRNSPPMKISTTDPEAALSSKRGASEFAYYDNYLIDNQSCIIAGVMATPARLSQEIIAARQMLERAKERFGLQPVSVTADKSYGTGEFLSWLSNRQMTPYIPVLDRKQQTKGFYTQHEFTRIPEENAYRCPAGHLLHYIGLSRGAQGFTYSAKPSQCRNCSHKPACTPSSTHRTLRVNWYEDVREHVRKLSQTPEYHCPPRSKQNRGVILRTAQQIRLQKCACVVCHGKEQFIWRQRSKTSNAGTVYKSKQRTGSSDGLKGHPPMPEDSPERAYWHFGSD